MTRPHEDLERHTPVDHRPGGPAIALTAPMWWAIAVVHVTKDRDDAAIASYETLVEKARNGAPKAHEAAVLNAKNHRRSIVLLHLDGRDAFNHLTSAWDDHHLFAERHAVAEGRSMGLYRVASVTGEATIDPASTDAYAFEHVLLGGERIQNAITSIAAAPGFRGVCVFETDDDRASAIVYRFGRIEDIQAFRATPPLRTAFGETAPGETFFQVHPVRTFA